MLQPNDTCDRNTNDHSHDGLVVTFTHPEDVLQSRALSVADKRAILASWASDAHAVPNLPSMRQLDSGAIVSIDTVLSALKVLDAREMATSPSQKRGSWAKRNVALLSRWRSSSSRKGDDDDEPPPCPAAALAPCVELELRRRRDAELSLIAA